MNGRINTLCSNLLYARDKRQREMLKQLELPEEQRDWKAWDALNTVIIQLEKELVEASLDAYTERKSLGK